MSPESLDHIYATALLQHTRFLADNFERAVYSQARQIVRNPQCSIVRHRINIVFGVEPEDDINDTARHRRTRKQQQQRQAEQVESGSHFDPFIFSIDPGASPSDGAHGSLRVYDKRFSTLAAQAFGHSELGRITPKKHWMG